jgi:hypothetical protein
MNHAEVKLDVPFVAHAFEAYEEDRLVLFVSHTAADERELQVLEQRLKQLLLCPPGRYAALRLKARGDRQAHWP